MIYNETIFVVHILCSLSDSCRYHYFTFEHSRDYQQVQFKFLDAVASMNPGNIAVSITPIIFIFKIHQNNLRNNIKTRVCCLTPEGTQQEGNEYKQKHTISKIPEIYIKYQ